MSAERLKRSGDLLLEVRGLRIEGQSDDAWQEIVRGIDLRFDAARCWG